MLSFEILALSYELKVVDVDVNPGDPIGCEVYGSNNGGLTWQKVSLEGLDLYNTYGYYFGKISISPVNAMYLTVSLSEYYSGRS